MLHGKPLLKEFMSSVWKGCRGFLCQRKWSNSRCGTDLSDKSPVFPRFFSRVFVVVDV